MKCSCSSHSLRSTSMPAYVPAPAREARLRSRVVPQSRRRGRSSPPPQSQATAERRPPRRGRRGRRGRRTGAARSRSSRRTRCRRTHTRSRTFPPPPRTRRSTSHLLVHGTEQRLIARSPNFAFLMRCKLHGPSPWSLRPIYRGSPLGHPPKHEAGGSQRRARKRAALWYRSVYPRSTRPNPVSILVNALPENEPTGSAGNPVGDATCP
jgi:hypothetical protein